ncbi:MAG: hypothetical protein ACOVQB_05920 [Polynucleobacter sp.]
MFNGNASPDESNLTLNPAISALANHTQPPGLVESASTSLSSGNEPLHHTPPEHDTRSLAVHAEGAPAFEGGLQSDTSESDHSGANSTSSSPSSSPEPHKPTKVFTTLEDEKPALDGLIDFTRASLEQDHRIDVDASKHGIELTTIVPGGHTSLTRPRETRDISQSLAAFLGRMGIDPDAFEASELGMLNVLFSERTWKQTLPTYVRLPSVSRVITKALFYLSIRKKDLAPLDAHSGLTLKELDQHLSLSGSALPLHNTDAITRAYRIAGFANTISWVGGVWLMLYLSLQINAFILAANSQSDYSMRDIFLEPFDLSKLFTGGSQSTRASLANSVSSYYVWPFLLGLPLIAGVLSGWRYGKMAQSTSEDALREALEQLEAYQPSLKMDYARWYLPKHPLSGPLNRVTLSMLHQHKLSSSLRQKIFSTLTQLATTAKGHTQIKARKAIAALAFDINPNDLILAKQAFPLNDYTPFIKTMGEAYSNLNGAAFSLKPNKHENHLDALLRAGNTRYISHEHQLGHAGFLMALFILYDFYVSYGDVSLSLIILRGLINAFKQIDEQRQCKQANKVWVWRKESKIYECSVCGDVLQIAYRDIWTQDTCVSAFLARTQPAQKIIDFFSSHHLQDVTHLDFSAQINTDYTVYHTANELDAIFTTLNQRVPKLYNFTFRGSNLAIIYNIIPDSSHVGAPIGRLIANATQLRLVDLSYLYLQTNGTLALLPYLPFANLTSLSLDTSRMGDDGVIALAKVLPALPQLNKLNIMDTRSTDLSAQSLVDALVAHPQLNDITFGSDFISDATGPIIAQLFLKPNLTAVFIYSGMYTDVALQDLAATLSSATSLESLSLEYWSMTDPSTILKLSDAFAKLTALKTLYFRGDSNDPTVPGMGYFFTQLPFLTQLNALSLFGSACVDEYSAADFGEFFPLSSVKNLEISYCYNLPLSVNATQQFTQGLVGSNVTNLKFYLLPLDNALTGNLHTVMQLRTLKSLELSYNNLNEAFNLALVPQLVGSSLESFSIYGTQGAYDNGITDTVLQQLAVILPQTQLNSIGFGDRNLTQLGIQPLFIQATEPSAQLSSLQIVSSNLGDDGAVTLFERLKNSNNQLNLLGLSNSQLTDKSTANIANALTRYVRSQLLWLDYLLINDRSVTVPSTQLNTLNLNGNSITAAGAKEILSVIPQTNIPLANVDLSGKNLTSAEASNIANAITSSASRTATVPWPVHLSYLLLVAMPQQLLSSSLSYISHKDADKSADDSLKHIWIGLMFSLIAYKLFSASFKKMANVPTGRVGFFSQRPEHAATVQELNIETSPYQ